MLSTRLSADIWHGQSNEISPTGLRAAAPVCWWPPRQRCLCHALPTFSQLLLEKEPASAECPCEQRVLSSGTGGFSESSPKESSPNSSSKEGQRKVLLSPTFHCGRAFSHQDLHTQTPGSGFSKRAKSPQRRVPKTSLEFKHISWQSWAYFLICVFSYWYRKHKVYLSLCS